MIISASYKTDIPAFYGQWFVNRLRAGFCLMRNPMNRKVVRVPMSPDLLDGIVFWTKNFRPFMKYLSIVEDCGAPFVVQYTINGYPRSLEQNVVDWRKSVQATIELSNRFGRRCTVWRYDTIVFTDETPRAFHVKNFTDICGALEGVVDEVVISFLHLYRKTERNLGVMARECNNSWWDPSLEEKRDLAKELSEIARSRSITLSVCSQPEITSSQPASRCIDSERLSDVAGRKIPSKTLGNRPGCECAASRDIGDYDTCPHGCVYCYAVRTPELALRRFRMHDPASPFLFSEPGDPMLGEPKGDLQLRLIE